MRFRNSVQMYEESFLFMVFMLMTTSSIIFAYPPNNVSTASTPLSSVVITSKPLIFVSNEGPTYTDSHGLVRSLRSRLRNILFSSSTDRPATTVSLTPSRTKMNVSSNETKRWFNRGSRFLCLTDEECKPLMTNLTAKTRNRTHDFKARSDSPTSYYGGESDDPWIELVGMKLPAVPMKPSTTLSTHKPSENSPVRNIVRLPSRIRPSRPLNSIHHQQHKIQNSVHNPTLETLNQIPYPSTETSSSIANNNPVGTERPHHDSFSYHKPYGNSSPRPTRSTTAYVGTIPLPTSTSSSSLLQMPTPSDIEETNSNVSTIHHAVVFKMLLLIAFIAVPILAATIPFLSPPVTRSSRTRRDDDALVDWATDTATLLSLTHLLSDGRLKKLLELSDEEFIDTLSGSVSKAVPGTDEDKEQQLKTTMLVLLETVKKHLEKNSTYVEEDSTYVEEDSTYVESEESDIDTNSLFMEQLLTKQFLPLQEHLKLLKIS